MWDLIFDIISVIRPFKLVLRHNPRSYLQNFSQNENHLGVYYHELLWYSLTANIGHIMFVYKFGQS